ncbi:MULTISPECIES: tRNA (adenosine(37)-N6)-threonylcarbamoyltransferase complex ATPase subunit type 1 TsaE [unclassified Campylobacter]|uniref:tRNA (adenosine(37)-N6)-threonylcarbamoyltransferase complex ATPase subunit type 1 TsaE n=1 Tax=unclassified Campylobacter TaxID=2593542 RepID=UPI00123839C3|nr:MULTISPECIES: tRNA (adenosine(37)-N6)-threonylcarbamoyltransferase complex ATPase subunit type 1 TsaE [unclassified Campylobacter]KAA6225085.1 tRNA (adenosine(37)-N6)-threonylcarbamoyltransferase complex ATPase subunit type 1 TsaE [Campylobacter sp. LR196d]KAA6226099.1 tRNA (adenosine(37)-N6)-threonylcarbamoyltransferase complex ATPase subunit type 1 TsaE [Campylobacter sp. LR185c]KAA6228046.1 tRNA (adenosine(37)-N6)-threonylcarbamoyltransferase complex ATPase subunit type 1 TsaE [Campylobact
MKEFILAKDELNELFSYLGINEVILLNGDLASGKTTLVQEYAKFLGFKDDINSPTFSIMQSYNNNEFILYHYDIYQGGFENLIKNGLFENFLEPGLHIVEWGDEKLEKALLKFGIKALKIDISIIDDKKRKYIVYE